MYGYAKFTLPILALTFTLAHAANELTPVNAGSKGITVTDQNGCAISLTTEKRKLVEPIKIIPGLQEGSLEDLLTNGMIRLYTKEFSPVPSKNKELMQAEADKIAVTIAETIFTNEFLATDEGQMNVQDWLSTRVGALPQNLLPSLSNGLNAKVAETRDPEARPPYAVEGDTAIGEITESLTRLDQKAKTLSVNGLANTSSGLGRLPIIQKTWLGRFFKTAGIILREEYQSVNDVIAQNDQALQSSIAGHRKSQYDLYDARIELTGIERYIEISEYLLLKLKEIATQRVQNARLSEQETQAITKYVLAPMTMRTQFIQRDSAQIMAAYVQFAEIMDYQLNVIALMENFRGSIAFQVQTAGYAKITLNSLQKSMNAMVNVQNAADSLLQSSYDSMKNLAIKLREFPKFMFDSQEKTIQVVGAMINEARAARQALVMDDTASQARIAEFHRRLESMREESGVVDRIALADKFIDETQGQKSEVLKMLPPPESKFPSDLAQHLIAK